MLAKISFPFVIVTLAMAPLIITYLPAMTVVIFSLIQITAAAYLISDSMPAIKELYKETLHFIVATQLYQFAEKPEDLAIPDITVIEESLSKLLVNVFYLILVLVSF